MTYQTEDMQAQNLDAEGKELRMGVDRPVMIHRAILGSVERMIAILTEHFGGKWYLPPASNRYRRPHFKTKTFLNDVQSDV